MVDAIDLRFVQMAPHRVVQLHRRSQVVPKRLLHHHARPVTAKRRADQAGRLQSGQGGLEQVGLDGEIEKVIGRIGLGVLQPVEQMVEGFLALLDIAAMIPDMLAEAPDVRGMGAQAAELGNGLGHGLPEALVRKVAPGKGHDTEFIRQQTVLLHGKQRGQQLALGQISRGPEDGDGQGIAHPHGGGTR
jgi:hypothetical protein